MAINVLVVDDSDVIRSMIKRTLHLANIGVGELFEASNGQEALGVLEESWVDLVMADINMPVMNGVDMVGHMRANPVTADVPVIVVSTEGATERIGDLTALGVAAWVRKPFTPEEIRDVIARVTSTWPASGPHEQLLDRAFALVMERFAFAFPEPVEVAALPDPGEELVVARIRFSGATSGALTIAAPNLLCAEIAANALGLDAEADEAFQRGADTLAEVLNMTAGHVATIVEADAATDLYPPSVERLFRCEWDRLARSGTARAYVVEGLPVLLALGIRVKHESLSA